MEAAPRNMVRRPKAEVSLSRPRRSTSTMLDEEKGKMRWKRRGKENKEKVQTKQVHQHNAE